MSISILGTRFRLSFPMALSMAVMGLVFHQDVLSPMAALLVHELGHIAAARSMRVQVIGVTAGPFGAAMSTSDCDRVSKAVVALGGPAASLVAATIAICAADLWPNLSFLQGFSTYSLVLCGFNLLPALPLDGGRILNAALEGVFSQKIANTIGLVCGICVCGVLFWMSFAFYPQIHLPILAITLFTLYGCMVEYRANSASAVTQMLKHERSLVNSGVMRLKTVGFSHDLRADKAASLLRGASFIAVLDENSRLMGAMSEGDLLSGMVELGGEAPMIEILRHVRSGNISLRSKF